MAEENQIVETGLGATVAFVPDQVRDRLGSTPRVTSGEYLSAMFDSQTLLGTAAENIAFYSAVAIGSDPDPNYNPFNDPSIRKEDRAYFMESRSAAETAMIWEKLRREREARQIIQAEGLTGRSVALTAIAMAPDMLAFGLAGKYLGPTAKFLSGTAEAGKGTSLATKVATGLGTNLAQEALAEAVKHAGQYERTASETAWNLVGAGLVGAAFPAAGAVWKRYITPERAANLARQLEPGVIEAITDAIAPETREALEAMNDPNSLIQGKPYEVNEQPKRLTSDWTSKVPLLKRLTPNNRRYQFKNPEVGKVLDGLLTYGKITDKTYDNVVENRINGVWLSKAREAEIRSYRAYERYVERHGISLRERAAAGLGAATDSPKVRGQFEDEVSRYVQMGADENELRAAGIEPDPDILDAAKANAEKYQFAAAELDAVGLTDELQPPKGSKGYFPRLPHAQKLKSKAVQFVNAVAPYMEVTPEDFAWGAKLGLDEDGIRRQIADNVRTKYLGIDGDTIGAGGRALKERTLTNVPDEVLRPFMVTRADEAMRIYMQKMGRRVELARQAPLSARLSGAMRQIDDLTAKIGRGELTKAQALDHAKNLELEARIIVEEMTGNPSFGGAENVRAQLKEAIDAEAKKRTTDFRVKYENERKAVDTAFGAKMKEIRQDADTDRALADFAFDQQKAAVKDDSVQKALALGEEYQKAVDDIRLRQEGELFQEQLAARKQVADVVERVDHYHEDLKSLRETLSRLDVFGKMEKEAFIDAHDFIDADIIDPENAKAGLRQLVSEYRENRNLTRGAIDALQSLKDADEGALKGLRETVRMIDKKARLLKAVDNLEGNIQNTDLAVEFFKAKGEYLVGLNESKWASRSEMARIASIRDLRIQEIRGAREESLEGLRDALRQFKDANKKLLKEDLGALREQVKATREAVKDKLGERAAAFRLAAAKDRMAAIRRMDANAMTNPETWADRLSPSYTRMRADIQARAAAGELGGDEANKAIREIDLDELKGKQAVRDAVKLIMGSFGHEKDLSGISRFSDFMRAWSYVTKMGKMLLTNAVDVPQPVLKLGWSHAIKGYRAALSMEGDQAVKDSMRAVAGALEAVNADRAMALADLGYSELDRTGGEMAIEWMASKMGKFTGFAYLNDATKTGAAFGFTDFLHRVAPLVEAGKATEVEKGILRLNGIDGAFAKEISRPEIWTDFAGVSKIPDFSKLTKAQAERISMAINTFVDTTVVSPRLGQIALLQRHWLGKALFQFKAFQVAQQESTLSFIADKMIAGTAAEKASAAAAVTATIGLGAGAVYLKAWAGGTEDEYLKDPNKWFADSVDQSGLMGLTMEANNLMEGVTGSFDKGRHRIGFRPLVGVEDGSFRYKGADVKSYVLGPSGDLAQAVYDTGAGAVRMGFGEAPSTYQMKQAMKLIPFNNVFWLTTMPYEAADFAGNLAGVFDLPEDREGIAEALGAKPSKKQKRAPL